MRLLRPPNHLRRGICCWKTDLAPLAQEHLSTHHCLRRARISTRCGGGGGLYCCEGVLIRAKTPNHPNHPNQSNQPKNPESAESAESPKDRESPESAKKHEAPASPESPRKRHLLSENGFSITCSGTFKHPSLLEAGEDSVRGALAVATVLGGSIVAGEC